MAFFVTVGLGGATGFFTGGGTTFFGATFFGVALTVGVGVGATAVLLPLRPSIMILPSCV